MSDTGFEHHFENFQAPPVEYTPVLEARDLSISYSGVIAVENVCIKIPPREITAFIGPSACGKSSILRSLDLMNDLIPGATTEGQVFYHDPDSGTQVDIYGPKIDPIEVRRRIGMVFQKPNPFPKTIYDNVAFGPRVVQRKKGDELDKIVETTLMQVGLWDNVKNKLTKRDAANKLSGGEQQRLCIARALAVGPDVILMDEPCSALDPISTAEVEQLAKDISADRTIVLVTHNMNQAARIASRTAFITVDVDDNGNRVGHLEEFDVSSKIFMNPDSPRTEGYITGRFG